MDMKPLGGPGGRSLKTQSPQARESPPRFGKIRCQDMTLVTIYCLIEKTLGLKSNLSCGDDGFWYLFENYKTDGSMNYLG